MNPWLGIPLQDYEGHMGLPEIGQAEFLADRLHQASRICASDSLAVLGCAGGNGLEKLNPASTSRVIAVDLNPEYVAAARQRHAFRFKTFEGISCDFLSSACCFEPVDLIFAGLIFEYLNWNQALGKIRNLLKRGGHLCAIVQLPCPQLSEVSPSPFASLKSLSSVMSLVSPEAFEAAATTAGLETIRHETHHLPSGKSFREWMFVSN